MLFLAQFLSISAMLVVLYAAYEDVRHLRLRNILALAVAALFVPMMFILPLHEVIQHVVVAAVIFAITVVLFFMGLFGGGDAKLIGAVALWASLQDLPALLLVMTFTGGLLALVALGLKRSGILPKMAVRTPSLFGPEDGWFAALARDETVVPYGVAIAAGMAVTLF